MNVTSGQTADALAGRLHAAGWTWGSTRALIDDRQMWIVDAHRCDGHRYVAHAATLPLAMAALAGLLPVDASAAQKATSYQKT